MRIEIATIDEGKQVMLQLLSIFQMKRWVEQWVSVRTPASSDTFRTWNTLLSVLRAGDGRPGTVNDVTGHNLTSHRTVWQNRDSFTAPE
jgi:hypothetical protein